MGCQTAFKTWTPIPQLMGSILHADSHTACRNGTGSCSYSAMNASAGRRPAPNWGSQSGLEDNSLDKIELYLEGSNLATSLLEKFEAELERFARGCRSFQWRCVIAVREVAATEKAAIGRPSSLDHVTRATRRTLTKGVAVDGLKAKVVASDLGELADISRWFAAVGERNTPRLARVRAT